MGKVVVFRGDSGAVAVLYPSPRCKYPIERIAQKDVPKGTPFWFFDSLMLPEDRSFRSAWELDEASMGNPDGVGDPEAFSDWHASEIGADGSRESFGGGI